MKTWDQFYPYVLPQVPGFVLPTVDIQLRLAAQEWCERTLCWREWLDDVTTTATDLQYDFEVDTDKQVVQLLRATLDGQDLEVLTPDQLPSNWRTAAAGCDRGIFTIDRVSFNVVPQQAADLVVQTEVALKPSITARGVDDQVFSQYVNEIANGAIGRMHMMPGAPWALPNSPLPAQFQAAIDKTASDVWHAHSRAPMRIRASFF